MVGPGGPLSCRSERHRSDRRAGQADDLLGERAWPPASAGLGGELGARGVARQSAIVAGGGKMTKSLTGRAGPGPTRRRPAWPWGAAQEADSARRRATTAVKTVRSAGGDVPSESSTWVRGPTTGWWYSPMMSMQRVRQLAPGVRGRSFGWKAFSRLRRRIPPAGCAAARRVHVGEGRAGRHSSCAAPPQGRPGSGPRCARRRHGMANSPGVPSRVGPAEHSSRS